MSHIILGIFIFKVAYFHDFVNLFLLGLIRKLFLLSHLNMPFYSVLFKLNFLLLIIIFVVVIIFTLI